MTKCEKIMVARQNFVPKTRGRSVEFQVLNYLRRIRDERNNDESAFAVRIPGWGVRYRDTLRRAVILAKRWKMRQGYDVDIFDVSTGICLRTV